MVVAQPSDRALTSPAQASMVAMEGLWIAGASRADATAGELALSQ